jgi:predicted RNA-binding Zn-ribbon protein involved in translation (DUF1610 family)
MENKFELMTDFRFMLYKRNHNTVPRCISCGQHLLIGDRITRTTEGKNLSHVKYLCSKCSNKDVVVYQYPLASQSKIFRSLAVREHHRLIVQNWRLRNAKI